MGGLLVCDEVKEIFFHEWFLVHALDKVFKIIYGSEINSSPHGFEMGFFILDLDVFGGSQRFGHKIPFGFQNKKEFLRSINFYLNCPVRVVATDGSTYLKPIGEFGVQFNIFVILKACGE